MKIAVLGGGGAMGGIFGGYLARAGEDVVLVDVSQASIDAIERDGLAIEEKDGSTATIRVKASSRPKDVGPVDLIVNFVKCYHTEAAIAAAAPMLPRIRRSSRFRTDGAMRIASPRWREIARDGRAHLSFGTLLGPGQVKHSGNGMTHVGELDSSQSPRLEAAVAAFRKAGIETTPSSRIIDEIWKKLALNVCTLPTAALLLSPPMNSSSTKGRSPSWRACSRRSSRWRRRRASVSIAPSAGRRSPTCSSKRSAHAPPCFRMSKRTGRRRSTSSTVRSSRPVHRHSVPTPLNDAMVWMVKSLQAKYLAAAKARDRFGASPVRSESRDSAAAR